MNILPRLTLRLRMSLSIAAIVALLTITNITYQLSSDNRNLRLDNLQAAVERQLSTVQIRQSLEDRQKQILVLDALDESGSERLNKEELTKASSEILALQQEVSQLQNYLNEDTSASFQTLYSRFDQLNTLWLDFYAGYNLKNTPNIANIEKHFTYSLIALSNFETLAIQSTEQQTVHIQKTVQYTDRISIAIYLFTTVLTIGLGYLLIRYTNRSLTDLHVGTIRVGSGDLDYHIPIKNDDEIGDLTIEFNEMADKLRNAMAQIQQSKENADQANRSKTNFLANMSHELRTPLNAIIGYSEMVIEDYREEKKLDEEQAIEDLKRILSAGRHLLQLINDVLDLAKIESGNMTVFNENFDSVKILEELISTMQPIASKAGNTLSIVCNDKIPELYNDAIKFRQLFLNLLSNACKFTQNGKIMITVLHDQHTQKAQFKVTDTGIGMTAEQLDKIFEAFVQAETSTSRKYGGTGLGLSICKQFVELMDGSLSVESQPNVGTTFAVSFSAQPAKSHSAEIIPAENQQEFDLDQNAKDKLLIIEQNHALANKLQQSLQQHHFDTLILNNTSEGLEAAKHDAFDGILMNLYADDIHSWAALEALKENEKSRGTPILLHNLTKAAQIKNLTFLSSPPINLLDRRRIATSIRQLNPTDRRGIALLIASDCMARKELINELIDEAWQCIAVESIAAIPEALNDKVPDIIFAGAAACNALRQADESTVNEQVNLKALFQQYTQRQNPDGKNPRRVPVYLLQEGSLFIEESRRLDLTFDELDLI